MACYIKNKQKNFISYLVDLLSLRLGSLSNLNHVYNKEHSRGEKQLCMNNLSKAYLTVITVNFKTMG